MTCWRKRLNVYLVLQDPGLGTCSPLKLRRRLSFGTTFLPCGVTLTVTPPVRLLSTCPRRIMLVDMPPRHAPTGRNPETGLFFQQWPSAWLLGHIAALKEAPLPSSRSGGGTTLSDDESARSERHCYLRADQQMNGVLLLHCRQLQVEGDSAAKGRRKQPIILYYIL